MIVFLAFESDTTVHQPSVELMLLPRMVVKSILQTQSLLDSSLRREKLIKREMESRCLYLIDLFLLRLRTF